MLQAGVGLSTQQDTEKAALEAAHVALTRAGSSAADFAIVFATASHGPGYPSCCEQFKKRHRHSRRWL
jgi:hypothetical protein